MSRYQWAIVGILAIGVLVVFGALAVLIQSSVARPISTPFPTATPTTMPSPTTIPTPTRAPTAAPTPDYTRLRHELKTIGPHGYYSQCSQDGVCFHAGRCEYKEKVSDRWGRFLLCVVAVGNATTGRIHTNPLHITLVDWDGFTYNVATETYGLSDFFDATDLQPNNHAVGWVAFKLTQDSVPRFLVYDDMWRTITLDFTKPERLTTPTPSPIPPTATATPTPLPVGSTITVNNWQIRVTNVVIADSLSSYGKTEKARGRFAILFLTITNKGYSPDTFVPVGILEIRDASGRAFVENAVATAYAMFNYNTDIGADINPDASANVVAVFDISKTSPRYVLTPGELAGSSSGSVLLDIP